MFPLFFLQALASPPPGNFDLAKLKSPDACATRTSDQIVVCATRRRAPAERIPVDPSAGSLLPKAEIGLFGTVRGSLHNEQNSVGGFPSDRVMVTITAPF